MKKVQHRAAHAALQIAVAASLLAVGQAPAQAESDAPAVSAAIAVGSRVRVAAPSIGSHRIEGSLLRLDEKTLLVQVRDGAPLSVPREGITRLDVSTGRQRQTVKWLQNGAVIGAAWVAAGCGLYGSCDDGWLSPVTGGAIAGAALGAGIGALVQRDRWHSVPLDRVQLTLTPTRRGVSLAAAIVF